MLAESLSPRLTQKPPPQRSGAGASQLLRERVPSPQSHPCKWRLDFPRFRSPSCHQTVGSRGMSTNLHLISIASELGRKRLRGFTARSGLCFVLFLEIGFGSHEEKRGTHSGKDKYQHTPLATTARTRSTPGWAHRRGTQRGRSQIHADAFVLSCLAAVSLCSRDRCSLFKPLEMTVSFPSKTEQSQVTCTAGQSAPSQVRLQPCVSTTSV